MKWICLLPFLICSLLSNAQNWAPDSAVWHYDLSLWAAAGYTKIVVDGDSVINGQTVRVHRKYQFIKNLITGNTTNSTIGTEYTYEDSNKVYYFRMGKFYTLYDFNAVAGDSWEIAGYPGGCDSTAFVTVDSIGFKYINDDTLKVLFMQSDLNKPWLLLGEIIEKVGNTSYMFPQQNCVTDETEGGPIRCYQDPDLGLFQRSVNSCEYLPTGIEESKDFPIAIYPVPAADQLYVHLPNHNFSGYTFYDMAGRQILKSVIAPDQKIIYIDINHFPAGIYHIKFESKDPSFSISKKVVIQ